MTISYHSGGRLQGIGTIQEITAVVGLSACSYDSVEVNFGSSGPMGPNQPMGIAFSADGSYLYVSAQNSTGTKQEIFQWALSTAWDLTTIGSTYYKKISVSTTNTAIKGIKFKPDGTKMYFLLNGQDTIYEYTLSTAWDVSTGSSASSKSTASTESQPYDFCFSDDGTIMLTFGNTSDRINEWDLSTAWTVSTASASGVYYDLTFQTETPQGIVWSNDGKRIWYCQGDSQAPWGHSMRIREITLSTAWDLSTVSSTSVNYQLYPSQPSAWCITKKTDDTKLYIGGNYTIRQYDIQITAGQEGATGDTKPTNVPDYSRFEETNTRKIYSLTPDVSTFDLPNISYTDSESIGSQTTVPAGVNFKSDGTKMYVLNGSADFKLYQYSLSPAWDISTASYDSVYAHVTGSDMTSISNWKSDGTKFFATDGYGSYGRIIEYTASTAWDISTLSAASTLTPSSAQKKPQGIYVKPDGTQLITVNTVYDRVYNYDMSTPWSVSTASYGGNSTDGFFVGYQVTNPVGVTFNSSGTKMFIHSPTNIYQYTLSTAWDVSTSSYDNVNKSVTGSIKDSQWKTDGSKLYLVNNTGDTIDEYEGGIESSSMSWKEKGTT